MKTKLILLFALLISALGFSQTIDVKVVDGDLTFTDTSNSTESERTYAAHASTYHYEAFTGKFQFFEYRDRIERKYVWTEFIEPVGYDFSTVQGVKDYLKEILNFKLGGDSGQSFAQLPTIVLFTTSRDILNTDIFNTIECTTLATLTITSNFSEMEIGNTINLEAHATILTITAATGVTLNGSVASSITVGDGSTYRAGILRKTATNTYVIF